MAKKCIRGPVVIKETQIETMMSYRLTPVGMATLRQTQNTAGEGLEKGNTDYVGGSVNSWGHYEKPIGRFLRKQERELTT